jgi:hypothetical protein
MVKPLAQSLKRCAAVLAVPVSALALAAEPATPPPESALAAAKRDYETFEQLSGVEADGSKAANEGRSLPPLETATEAPPSLSPIQRARKAATEEADQGTEPSKTWLIDAFDALADKGSSRSMKLEGASLEEELEETRMSTATAGEGQRFFPGFHRHCRT